jgi:hypothetical protein
MLGMPGNRKRSRGDCACERLARGRSALAWTPGVPLGAFGGFNKINEFKRGSRGRMARH